MNNTTSADNPRNQIQKKVKNLRPGDIVLSDPKHPRQVTGMPQKCRQNGYYRVETMDAENPVNTHGDQTVPIATEEFKFTLQAAKSVLNGVGIKA